MWDIAFKAAQMPFQLAAQEYSYQAKASSIDAQIESHELALEDRISARNQRLTNDLQSMRVAQAARGVEGGSGVFAGIEKSAERDIRAEKINTANVLRGLHQQKSIADTERTLGAVTTMIGGGADIYDMV